MLKCGGDAGAAAADLAAAHKQGRSFHKLCVFSILIGFIFLTTGGLRGAPGGISGAVRGGRGLDRDRKTATVWLSALSPYFING